MSCSAATHEHVQRMLTHIQRNYTQRLTLRTLAKTLGRQSAYLGRLFRDEVGVTVHEYMTRARMVNGAVQVRSGVKVEAVALDLGYQSKKNFYRQFKRRFGMTPETYRHVHHGAPNAASAAIDPSREAREPSRDANDSQAVTLDASAFIEAPGRLKMVPARLRVRASPPTLLAAQKMMRMLLGSRLALLVTDGTGCYVGANNAAMYMTGYSVDELRGQPVGKLFPYLSDSATRCRLQILLQASSYAPTNTVLHTKSAGPVRVHLTSADNVLEDRPRRTAAL